MSLEFKCTYKDYYNIRYNSTDNKAQIRFLTERDSSGNAIYICKKLANDPEKTISIMFKINTMNMHTIFDDINYLESISSILKITFDFTDEKFRIKKVYDLFGLDLCYKYTSLENFLDERDLDPATLSLYSNPGYSDNGLPYWEKGSGITIDIKNENQKIFDDIKTQMIDLMNILNSRNFFKRLIEDSLTSIFSNPEYVEELKELYER